VGAIMFVFGSFMLWSQFGMLRHSAGRSELKLMGPQFELSAVWLATAAALILLGLKSAREHRRRATAG
ncbi:MAG TPA: hypothetical protein VMM37_05735, partial [Bacteroidota bacterium]|nr:hypothetical protein [Bacteroidota bacterium]